MNMTTNRKIDNLKVLLDLNKKPPIEVIKKNINNCY